MAGAAGVALSAAAGSMIDAALIGAIGMDALILVNCGPGMEALGEALVAA